ncbi:hypothetical protein B0H10DRAFT_1956521 [Mycena sp. CBHHK59/15]|nr:hypothetical protein B0H10DRAFT_1956521 [Mycena sp. CBHHK59/15]
MVRHLIFLLESHIQLSIETHSLQPEALRGQNSGSRIGQSRALENCLGHPLQGAFGGGTLDDIIQRAAEPGAWTFRRLCNTYDPTHFERSVYVLRTGEYTCLGYVLDYGRKTIHLVPRLMKETKAYQANVIMNFRPTWLDGQNISHQENDERHPELEASPSSVFFVVLIDSAATGLYTLSLDLASVEKSQVCLKESFRVQLAHFWRILTTPRLLDLGITSLCDKGDGVESWDQTVFIAFRRRSGFALGKLLLCYDFSWRLRDIVEILLFSPTVDDLTFRCIGRLRSVKMDATSGTIRMLKSIYSMLRDVTLFVEEHHATKYFSDIRWLREQGIRVKKLYGRGGEEPRVI